jgi:hypothetical protein
MSFFFTCYVISSINAQQTVDFDEVFGGFSFFVNCSAGGEDGGTRYI